MTKTMFLTKGLAAAVLALLVASCNKMEFAQTPQISSEEIKANAEQALGVTIDPNQTWVMTQNVTASITVTKDYGETYEVAVYENDPLADNSGILLGKSSVVSGSTARFSFTAAKGTSLVYAAIKDPKGYTYVKPTAIIDGKLETSFGTNSSSAANVSRRALTLNAADDFEIPTYSQPSVSQYLDGAAELDSHNASNDYPLSDLTAEEQALIPESDKIQMEGWVKVSQKKLKMTTDWSAAIPALGLTDSEQGEFARTLYIENATWNVPENTYLQVGQGTVIVVGANGHINIPASATIKFTGNASHNCRLIVLSTGSITGQGTLEFANGSLAGNYDYNAGTISVGKLNNNGGEFYNAGTLRATVLAGGAGKSTYINAGKFYITRSDYGSGSSNTRILNNCWFEAEENLFARNIVQGEGAYMGVGGNFEMSCGNDGTSDPAYYYAKDNSLLDVRGAAGFNNIDFVGPTGDNYAFLQFNYIEDARSTHQLHNATNYTGWPDITCGAIINNFYVSVDNYQDYGACKKVFTEMLNGTAGQGKQVGNGNAAHVNKGQYTAAVVEEDECSPGVNIVNPTPVVVTHPIYSYAFEDTQLGDYDMNDVVIKAQLSSDSTKINLMLVAAGATLDLNIRLYPAASLVGNEVAHYPEAEEGYTTLSYNNQEEIHAMLGVSSGTMVNTGTGKTATPITIPIPKGSYDPAHLPLAIYSASQGEMRLAGAGEAPFGVIVPMDWSWPRERVNITTAYNEVETESEGDQSFGSYAHNANQALNWYNHPTESVMK